MINLKLKKGFALDMDGTFYLGEQLLPGALDLLDYLNSNGIQFSFLTNNSSKSRRKYVEKLLTMGVKETDARVFTSGDATIEYLKNECSGASVFLLGTESLKREFLGAGISIVQEEPDILVLGYDTGLNYQSLSKFCLLVRTGLPYFATHPDLNCPSPEGPLPDAGSIMQLIRASTGRMPEKVFGKPEPNIMNLLADRWGMNLEDVVMVGDRLYTDIALGTTSGVSTVLVLSGETQLEDLQASPYQPDFVFRDLAELVETLSK